MLYIEPVSDNTGYAAVLEQQFKEISTKFPGVELYKTAKGWSVKLPEYLNNSKLPAWAKYYTTTKALELAVKNK